MKKIFLIIAVLFSFSSLWADELLINGLYYWLNEETLTATASIHSEEDFWWLDEDGGEEWDGDEGYNGNTTPTELVDVTVRTNVTHFSKKYTVTSIAWGGFYGCKGIGSITLPKTITSIGDEAFYGCSSLTSFSIGANIKSIGSDIFGGCIGLTSITVASGNTFYDSRNNCNAIIKTASNTLIAGCSKTVIPNDVTTIGFGAFEYCSSLTEITIPTSVTCIDAYAFQGCSGLSSLCIPTSVTKIGEDAFGGCSGLTYVEIHCSEIGRNVFYSYNNSIETLILGNELTKVEQGIFVDWSNLTTLTIPQSLTDIGRDAFKNCSKLKNVIVSINDISAFCNNNSIHLVNSSVNNVQLIDLNGNEIREYVVPNTVTSIGDNAFKYCSGLTAITIPNSVTSINENAFYNCSGLTALAIPSSVTSIGDNSFYNCSGLTSLAIPSSVTSIGNNAFYNCSGLTSITVDAGNSVYDSRDNCNAVIETATNTLMLGCKNTIIPQGIKNISSNAFLNCSSMSSITIPYSVTSIGNNAFSGCSKLIDVYVENPTPISIGSDVFSSRSYATLYVPQGSRDSYRAAVTWREFKEILESEARSNQTLSFENIPAMTYGDVPFTLPGITNEGLSLVWTSSNTNVAVISGNTLTIKGAGTAAIIATQAGNDAYQPFTKNFSLTIAKAPLTITADNMEKEEGEANPSFTFSYDGFVYDDDASCLTKQPRATTTATASSAPGTYPITVSGAESTNYDITYVDGTLTVNSALPYVTLELNSEYTLFTPQKDVDMTNVSGVEAYVPVHYSLLDNIIKLERAYSIPAGTGLLIKGTPGTYRLPLTVANESYADLLKGVLGATTINRRTDNLVNLILSADNTFVPVADGTSIAAHSAYLQLPASVYTSSAPVAIDLQSGVSGDTNNDGKITIADVMKLLQMVVNN